MAAAADRMQFPARGRSVVGMVKAQEEEEEDEAEEGKWRQCRQHQRPLKAIRNLSRASTACQLASHSLRSAVRPDVSFSNTHTHIHTFGVFTNVCVCVCEWPG